MPAILDEDFDPVDVEEALGQIITEALAQEEQHVEEELAQQEAAANDAVVQDKAREEAQRRRASCKLPLTKGHRTV